jgi:hypothetical protein
MICPCFPDLSVGGVPDEDDSFDLTTNPSYNPNIPRLTAVNPESTRMVLVKVIVGVLFPL